MPLYEYECEKCGAVFEVRQKFSDEPLSVHEQCGGTVRRLISPPALQFKGTGWYVTDYARGGGNGSKKSGSESKAGSESGSGSKPGESKTGESKAAESKAGESKPSTGDKSKTE